jgi:hypothetical protein
VTGEAPARASAVTLAFVMPAALVGHAVRRGLTAYYDDLDRRASGDDGLM